LQLLTSRGEPIETNDRVGTFGDELRAAKIGALKGLGGYHLVCDATNATAVARLRQRKERDDKPLAIMVASIEHAESLCDVTSAERELLVSPARPIVLLRRKKERGKTCATPRYVTESAAPGNPYLGVMLPYTPLHHLLVEAVGGIPLVMTSGNRSDEPIAYEDDAVFEQLGDIADVFLIHDRPIHIRCDDSVTRVVDDQPSPVRRSRGYAPLPMGLPFACPRPLLAVGGQLKSTFALGRAQTAILSHHLGDLDDYHAYRAFERDIALYEELFDTRPQRIVHDLHPDYASTGYAQRRAAAEEIDTLAVQHHHAHVAACMAEHALAGDVIGVAFDGTGFGSDGAIWGGEFLVANYGEFRRGAHLRYVPLPGGDHAIRHPWRSAVTHALDAGCDLSRCDAIASTTELRTVRQMIERRVNSPSTSSAGRLFDAVAALAGIRASVTFEGQAAMELEWLATDEPPDVSYPFELSRSVPPAEPSCLEIDTRPMVRSVMGDVRRGTDRRRVARRFQSTMVELIVAVCERIRGETGLDRVVLSGGVFLNVLLTREATERLTADGFQVYRHLLVPTNDGGISLGQLAVAAAQANHPSARAREPKSVEPVMTPSDRQ
jgi:hydrogenase maturation protein HypF